MNTEDQRRRWIEVGPDAVARRADQIWEAAGRPAGRELEHWLQAETELRELSHRRILKLILPHAGPVLPRP